MTEPTERNPHGLDLDGIMAALKRAAARAREEAARSGTKLVLVRDGKLELVSPEDAELAARASEDTPEA